MQDRSLSDVAADWLKLWNGDLGLLDRIVADTIVTHVVPPGSTRLEEQRGRDALPTWISQTHASFSETTTYEVGPIIGDPYFVVRWHSTGTYRGGTPGVPAEAVGRPIDFRGIDIVRVDGGQAVEFWISWDTPVLMAQLGGGG